MGLCLVRRRGQKVEAWTYDGGLPGPLIRVRVGDRLIVHFTNKLPQPTTVHWRGLRVPIQMEGVAGYSQPEVQPGAQFTYDFVVPDAGLFWYHPHVASAAQVGFGLYGPLLVEDPSESERVGVKDELVVVLSDIGLDEKGVLESPDSGGTTGMAFGREGTLVLVNGHTASAKLTVRAGAPQRWRIVNAAKSRYFSLDIDGQTFVRIGSDGGLQEYPVDSTNFVMAPGERADVIVTPAGKPGTAFTFRSFVFNRGYGSIEFRPAEENLFAVAIADLPAYAGPPTPKVQRPIAALSSAGATPINLEFTLEQLRDGSFEYGINHVPFWKAKPILAKPGDTQIWTINNTTAWSHPFYLHVFFFQVLDANGVPLRPLAWKDTVNVPFKETVRLLVRFDDDRPGNWMFHCHILDHADGGLMGAVQVGTPPAGTSETPHQHRP